MLSLRFQSFNRVRVIQCAIPRHRWIECLGNRSWHLVSGNQNFIRCQPEDYFLRHRTPSMPPSLDVATKR